MDRKKPIVIVLEGGLVQDVGGVPKGTVVEVHDYDTDGGSSRDRKDKAGRMYHLSSWEVGE